MTNIGQVLQRMREYTSTKSDRELSSFINLPPADFSNRKRRGTIEPVILKWAIAEGIDLNWLFTGVSATETIERQLYERDLDASLEMLNKGTDTIAASIAFKIMIVQDLATPNRTQPDLAGHIFGQLFSKIYKKATNKDSEPLVRAELENFVKVELLKIQSEASNND